MKNPELFSEILADFETMGLTGEDANKLVGYLAATSRKLADPLAELIQSRYTCVNTFATHLLEARPGMPPHRPGTAWTRGCLHNHDLHTCAQRAGTFGPEPG